MTEKLVNVVCEKHSLQHDKLADFRYLSGTLELVLASAANLALITKHPFSAVILTVDSGPVGLMVIGGAQR